MQAIFRICAIVMCVIGCHACSTTGSTISLDDAETDTNARQSGSSDLATQPRPNAGGDGEIVPAILGIPPTSDSDATYRIGPDDLLRIEVFRVEDLSSEERVSEEGYIIISLVGAVEVGGLTPREAEQLISSKLRKYLRDPQVNIFVTEYASQNVTVAGAVEAPGVFQLKGRTTLMQMIAEAGGLDKLANDDEVVIFRLQDDQSTQAYIVSLEKIQDGALSDPVLVGNDRVFVPESGTAVFVKGLSDTLRGFVRVPGLYY